MDVLHASPEPVLDLPLEDRLHREFDVARRRVAESRTRLDTVLDMGNDAVPASR